MTTIRAVVIGGRDTAAWLTFLGVQAQREAHSLTVYWGQTLQLAVKAGASGRPGPNIITGDYRRSIHRKSTRLPGGTQVEVGTDSPQGYRLEMGFHGVDSRGRHYNQPPFPHFGPAFDNVAPKYAVAIERLVDRLVASA